MRRFILPDSASITQEITLSGDLYRHIVTVLRLPVGATIELADRHGNRCMAQIIRITPGVLTLEQTGDPIQSVSLLRITLYQGIPKGDKLDLIIEKATELGVSKIVPFAAERSVTRLKKERIPERIKRWEKIAAQAAQQSRAALPTITLAANLAEAVQESREDLRIIAWEEEKFGRLSTLPTIETPASIALLIGPEGGISREEALTASAHGFLPVTLGPRILRTETAGIALLAMVQQRWGDMG